MLVNAIFHFPTHMVFFTTPELLEIGGLPLVTPFDKPTRLERSATTGEWSTPTTCRSPFTRR